MFKEKIRRYVRTEYGYILENTTGGHGDIIKKLVDGDKHYEFEYGKIVKSSNTLVAIIEVGDYVRSRNGSIGKVTKIEDDKYLYENKELITFIGNVVKHSKNIIDLIEVGDLVFIEDFFNYSFIHIFDETMLEALKEDIKEDVKIKSILTHEQYSQNCYTVERS